MTKDVMNKVLKQPLRMCKPQSSVHFAIACKFAYIEGEKHKCVLHDKQNTYCRIYVEEIRK